MTVWQWFLEHRGAFLRAGGWIALILVPTFIVGACLQNDPDFDLQAAFPNRTSDTIDSKIVAYVAEDSSPVSGAELTLTAGWYDGGDKSVVEQLVQTSPELATATTAANGMATLTLPPRAKILETIGEKPEKTEQFFIALNAEYDGERRVHFRLMPAAASPRAVLTLDRPLYQPGQRMMARVLLVDRDLGQPIKAEGSWSLKNAENQVLARRKSTVSEFGIASAEFPLSKHLKPGELQLEFKAPNVTVTRGVTVKPYRLPRFKVTVEGPASPVRPSDVVTFKVKGAYTYGSPLVGADVSFQSTVGGVPQVEQIGKTDDSGVTTFVVSVPADAQPGTGISVVANATLDTGRSEQGVGSAVVAGQLLRLELFPKGAYRFTPSVSNPGILYVANGQGQPVENANVTFTMGEASVERESTATTDSHGIAEFEWTPGPEAESRYILVDVRKGADGMRQTFRPPVGEDLLRLSQSVLAPGDTLTTTTRDDGLIVVAKDGLILGAADINNGSAQVKIETSARGLATVMNYQRGRLAESKPIWVRSGTSDRVEIDLNPQYKPGDRAKVKLSVPGSKSKTAFGLIGVDEALYALAERSDPPFTAEARGVPPHANTVMSFLLSTDLPPALWTARFLNGLQSANMEHGVQTYNRDITKDVRIRSLFWAAVLILVLLAGVILYFSLRAGSSTVQAFYVDAFSWRRLASFFGISLLSAFAGFWFGVGGEDFLAGGLAVWSGVIACWMIAAAVRNPEVPLGRWLISLAFLVFSFAVFGIWIEEFAKFDGQSTDAILAIAFIALPAVLLVIESVIWCFLMAGHGWRKASFGLLSVVGALLLGVTGGAVASLGGSSMHKMAKFEAAPSVSRMADDEFAAEMPMEEGVGGLAMKGEPKQNLPAGGKNAAPKVRSWFPETMVFLPEIVGDGNEATAVFRVPDSITTWRLNAYANSVDGDIASGQKGMKVIKKFFVELDVPPRLIEGDEVEVAMTVVNETSKTLAGSLTTNGDETLTINGGAKLTIAPKSRETVFAKVRATAIGVGKVRATFRDDVSSQWQKKMPSTDAVERPIVVVADGRSAQSSTSTFVKNEWVAKPDIHPQVIDGSLDAHLRLFPNVAAQALDGIESMLRLPNGCFEQTSSANYPNVLVSLALEDAKPEAFPDGEEGLQRARKKARELIELGYQKMLTFRNYDGGFGLYSGKSSDLMLTAYGVLQLIEMEKVIEIDESVKLSAINYLMNNQQDDGSWSKYSGRISGGSGGGGVDIGKARATAFIALAIASVDDQRSKNATKSASDYLDKMIQERALSTDVLALSSNVFVLNGDMDRAKTALAKLVPDLVKRGDVAWVATKHDIWFGARGSTANLQVTAQAAYAMLKADLYAEHAAPMIRFLAQERSWWGGWGSTQATVWSLRTLTALQDDVAKTTDVNVSLGGELIASVANKESPLELAIDSPTYVDYDLPNASEVTVTASRIMNFGAHLVATYAIPWSTEVDDEPFSIETKATTDLTFGKPHSMVVSFRSGEKSWSNVIVELPIGPGGYVDEAKLNAWKSQGRVSEIEVGLDRIRLYINQVPANVDTVFAYDWTPLVKGSYRLPSVRVFPFYNPEMISESQSPKVTVR